MLEQVKVLSFPVEGSQTAHDRNRWEMAVDGRFRPWSGCGHNHSRCSRCSRCSRSRTLPPVRAEQLPAFPSGRGLCPVGGAGITWCPVPPPRPVRHVRSFRRARWRWRSPGPGLAAGAVTAPSCGQGSASPERPGAAAVPFPRSGAESGCVIFLSLVAAFPARSPAGVPDPRRAPRCTVAQPPGSGRAAPAGPAVGEGPGRSPEPVRVAGNVA